MSDVELYTPVGDAQRIAVALNASMDIHEPEGDVTYVRSFDIAEEAVLDHAPFFASEAEAAGCTQWLTVAALPWVEGETLYLQAGWVNGMLALRIEEVDSGPSVDTNDDQAGTWNFCLVHRSQADELLLGEGGVNLHGLSCWHVAYYWVPIINNGHFGNSVGDKVYNVYMYILAGCVFFRVVSSADWRKYDGVYNDARFIPFGRLPSLSTVGGYACKNADGMSEEAAKGKDYKTYNPSLFEEYEPLGLDPYMLVAHYYKEYEYTLWYGEAYTLKCFLTINLRRWDHCELLSHLCGIYEYGEGVDEGEVEPERPLDGGGGAAGGFNPDDPDDEPSGGGFDDPDEEPSGGISLDYGYLAGDGVSITNAVAGTRNGSPCYRAKLVIKASYLTSLLARLSCPGAVQFNANHVFNGATADIEMGIQSSTADAAGLAVTGELALEFAGTDGDDASTKTETHALAYSISPDISSDQLQAIYTDTRYDSTMWLDVTPCEAPANSKFTAQKWYRISVNATAYKAEALATMKSELSAKVALSSATMTDHGETLQATATGDALALTITVN